MKKHAIPAFVLALVAVLAFASCDVITNFIASRTRNIAVIQIFNSNREETKYFQPNDTMYVQVAGLAANGIYKVDCLDPYGNLITTMTAQADSNGVIAPSPLWYDVGFKKEWSNSLNRYVAVLPTPTELGLNAFNIRVHDASVAASATDFKLPFFVIFNKNIARPKPIVLASRMDSGTIVVENDFKAGEDLYVQVANLTELPTPAPASGKVMVYLVPFDGGYYKDGDPISPYVVKQEAMVDDLKTGVKITATSELWAHGDSWATGIPAYFKGKALSVIVDVNEDGIYEEKKEGTTDYYLDGIDGNGVAGFVVEKDPVVIPPANKKYIPANIASGGITWQHAWFENWPDYDYRDSFNADGSGTQYGWDWQYGGYGVKAIWNPYLSNDPQVPNSDATSLYYGKYVDVYIVNSADVDLTGRTKISPATGTYKMTMPVQYACTNGACQQTIWRAPMTAGSYCVVVDVDQDGYITDGDLVDNLHKTESTPSDGIGFTVVQ
jgi:hypothetical protein